MGLGTRTTLRMIVTTMAPARRLPFPRIAQPIAPKMSLPPYRASLAALIGAVSCFVSPASSISPCFLPWDLKSNSYFSFILCLSCFSQGAGERANGGSTTVRLLLLIARGRTPWRHWPFRDLAHLFLFPSNRARLCFLPVAFRRA